MSSELMRHNGMEEDPEGAFVYQDDANRIIKKLEERLKDIPCKRYVAADKLCESVAELQIQNEALEEHVKKLKGDLAEEELPALWEALHDRNVRIEELETQKVIADAHNEDALAFIKQKGLFDEYYEGAGDWEQQR